MMPELVYLLGLLLRWEVSLYSYSGEGLGPLFGDYEAQRHWMEVTYNLPSSDWYRPTVDNDLQYWGLDYPPLTAYHSLLCGVIASFIDPQYVILYKSRGYESAPHKLFMRSTVIVSDLLTFLTASYFYFKVVQFKSLICHLMVFTYPGLILIDHGHFQYNCVSLGFVIFSISALKKDYDILSCVMFCLSFSFKQMSLYYALPFFFYFFGKCVKEARSKSYISGLKILVKLSLSVILTVSVVWGPFLFNLNHVLNRVFPLARGIFEDKVSNVWCLLNLFYKFKIMLPNSVMAILCSAVTLTAVLPSCFNIFLNPRKDMFLLTLINSSLSFFLFSFQVHEKSILLVALPVMFYFKYDPFQCFWFLLISSFSMLPLFIKDGLIIPFLILTSFYIIVFISFFPFVHFESNKQIYLKCCMTLSFNGCCILTYCILFIEPPTKYPDLFPLLISVYSACHFLYFFVYFNYKQLACNVIHKQSI